MRFATAPSQERACALQRARLTSKPIHHCSLQRSGYNSRAYLLAWRCQRTSPSRSNRPNSIFTWLSGSAQDAPQDVSPGYKGQGGWGKGGSRCRRGSTMFLAAPDCYEKGNMKLLPAPSRNGPLSHRLRSLCESGDILAGTKGIIL
jgi:hypothetical protein